MGSVAWTADDQGTEGSTAASPFTAVRSAIAPFAAHSFFGSIIVIKPVVLLLALFAVSTPAWAQSNVAPADEYFGRLKMSVLGIANIIKDMRLRVEADASRTPSIFGALANAEDALRDWEGKYPHDSWIPRNLLALETCYLAASGQHARALDEAMVAQQPGTAATEGER